MKCKIESSFVLDLHGFHSTTKFMHTLRNNYIKCDIIGPNFSPCQIAWYSGFPLWFAVRASVSVVIKLKATATAASDVFWWLLCIVVLVIAWNLYHLPHEFVCFLSLDVSHFIVMGIRTYSLHYIKQIKMSYVISSQRWHGMIESQITSEIDDRFTTMYMWVITVFMWYMYWSLGMSA